MLKNAMIGATVPVTDVNRARDFYENVLGLTPEETGPDGPTFYACANGTMFGLYERPGHTPAGQTVAAFMVPDAEAAVEDLIGKGVEFLQYDMPEAGIKTDERGLAQLGPSYGAWFTDPDGNIFGVFEVPGA